MKIPEGYEFGVVQTDKELEELIEFNSEVHDEDDAEELRRQIENLPGFGRELNFYIRDVDKGFIVTSLNAVPSLWAYEEVVLQNLELGWVGTLKEYRRKGLVRVLYEHFDKLLHEGEYDISTIQGIPYYYRQFGYDFVLPMDRTLWLTVDQLPTIDEEKKPEYMTVQIREAIPNDLNEIMNLYDEHNRQLQVYISRSRELWEVQEETKMEFESEYRTFVLEDNNGVIGYLRLAKPKKSKGPYGSTLRVMESSIKTYPGVMRTLQLIKAEALKNEFYRVGITGPSTNNLSRIALDLGGQIRGGWKHQLRIPSILHLLQKISPVLEKRLLGSMFEGLTKDLTINTFRNCYLLKFVNGKVKNITDIGMQEVDESRGFRAPPNDLVRLIFGVNDIDEIRNNNIDFIVSWELKSLVATLFPKGESCIYYYMC
ncbi:MAG: GNAT family N-acetyltransferase [Candidatus Thorarchaeota archaeon]|jgi:predicted N-acetyltransferase YhbS